MRPGFVHGARLTWSPSGTPYTDLLVALRDGVTLPLVAVRAAGVVSAVARRFVDALRR
jgi:hypothetical protein